MQEEFDINKIREDWIEERVEVDKEQFWDELEPLLPNNKRNKYFFVMILLLGAGFYFGYNFSKVEKSLGLENVETSSINKKPISVVKEIRNASTSVSQLDLKEETKSGLKQNKNLKEIRLEESVLKNKNIKDEKNSLNFKNLEKTKDRSKTGIARKSITKEGITKVLNPLAPKKNNQVQEEKIAKTKFERAIELDIPLAKQLEINTLPINRAQIVLGKDAFLIVQANKRRNMRLLGYRAGTTVSDFEYTSTETDQDYINNANQTIRNRINWYQELTVGVKLKKVAVNIGLRYSQNQHRFEYHKLEPNEEIRIVEHTNKENLISFPVRFSYYLNRNERKFNLYSFVETHFNLMSQLSGKMISENEEIITLDNPNGAGLTFLSYVETGIGLERKLTPNVSFNLAIVANMIRNKYLINSREIKFNNKGLGLNLGFNYRI